MPVAGLAATSGGPSAGQPSTDATSAPPSEARPKKPKKPKKPAKKAKKPKSAPAAQPLVGIGEQKASMFADPRFQALGTKIVRANVRWDVMTNPRLLGELDAWMAGARAAGIRPLLTFDRGWQQSTYNPTPAQLVQAMNDIRKRYPEAREFSTWNEANINKRPEVVARWWRALTKACPTCTVLGVDLLDWPGVNGWAKRFIKAAGKTPAIWGLHNYVGMNRLSTRSTLSLMKAVPGKFWLTETGGIVSRNNGSKIVLPTGVPHAAEVTKFILGPMLAAGGPRIERVYLYNWTPGPVVTTWDSGFIGPDGNARPALTALATYLGKTLPAE